MNQEQFAALFAAIPGHVVTLDLGQNLDPNPPGVKTLCLANNNLGPVLIVTDLVGALKLARSFKDSSQQEITGLDLSNKVLKKLSSDF